MGSSFQAIVIYSVVLLCLCNAGNSGGSSLLIQGPALMNWEAEDTLSSDQESMDGLRCLL